MHASRNLDKLLKSKVYLEMFTDMMAMRELQGLSQ